MASIYSINITNIDNGVSDKCEKCHFQTNSKSKVFCIKLIQAASILFSVINFVLMLV